MRRVVQDEIRDLLNPDAAGLKIMDHPLAGPYVRGITEEVVLTPERVLEVRGGGSRRLGICWQPPVSRSSWRSMSPAPCPLPPHSSWRSARRTGTSRRRT